MADTLEENYFLDDNEAGSVVGSDDGAVSIQDEPEHSNEEQSGEPSAPRQSAQDIKDEAARKADKNRKRKEKEKARKQKRAAQSADFAQGVGSVATQPPDMQADYLATKQSVSFAKLSELELEELRLRESMLLDTTAFDKPRTVDTLADFVRACMPSIAKSVTNAKDASVSQPGRPALVILTGNALRAAELARGLRPLGPQLPTSAEASSNDDGSAGPAKRRKVDKDGSKGQSKEGKKGEAKESSSSSSYKALLGGFSVAKLFARHFKLKEHEAWLREQTTPLAAGTPQRVAALIASGSLHLDSLQALVIDQTWVDAKQRSVFDSFETRDELMKLLALDAVMGSFKRSKAPAKLVLF
ncbi:hypothetical protein PSEUBRA_000776 [Kalmanozyma brasiliensis GHG001]|uniref:Uncharacterized protein n=1 Tax=Kalmanozyma brasiliensis (strain GHG001) TaxID=1365824 RepID=V5F2F7_KALBG|nr:uncharacterized protein PSEUBRA_000776 [Kalmanozyma brasiliensis GHG001]EST09559.1 hypothetical protein PSEUBRA_000776 [Kalmanozyma brasiliensis GHG001]